MKPSLLLKTALAVVLGASIAHAAPITVSHTVNWDAATNVHGTTYTGFLEPALPSWTHLVAFEPAAASIVSVSLQISHSGNRSSAVEMWFLTDLAAVLIGELQGSSNSANSFRSDIFEVPASMLPLLPATSWTLALQLNESTSTVNTIYLDFSRLTVVYNPATTSQGPNDSDSQQDPQGGEGNGVIPEPAMLALLGMVALGVRRLRRK